MAYNLQKSSFLSSGRPALAPRVCSRNSSRVATPVRALFGFGAPKKPVISQRALELEDELFATVRGAQPGKLAPKNEEKLDEILAEIRSFGDRNAARNLDGEYKLVYASRTIGPSGIVSVKNQALVFEDGEVSKKADLTVFGVALGSAVSSGDLKITGSNSYKVVFGNRVVTGFSESLLPKNEGNADSPPEFQYNVFYLGTSAFVATASVSTSDKEPVVLVFRKAGVKPAPPQPAEPEAVPQKREGRAGRATRAEREYKERSRVAAQAKQPAPAAEKEEKKSSGGFFGGFFAPPRYVDDEGEEEEEEAPAPRARARGRAAPVKAPQVKSPAKAKAGASAREQEAARRKEEAEQKAAEAAAKKEQAAAERAAAQQKKQEIQEFLKQLSADVKAAQAESRNAIQNFKEASRENANVLKSSSVAKQLIERAEASVMEAAEEIEELSSAEKQAANDLREAQKQLQKLSN
ncbi:hypothetical protein BSKO_00365 [Bryopsis sp. KO-2023]|nr:hypothetical protein BSKO_00365 [Bryopsis sp. KO-2023]